MVPAQPKLYHIVHVDRLPSILQSGGLLCDAVMATRAATGTVIGMASIKRRRLHELTLVSHPGLHVGACMPFYFCPRSIMLFLLHKGNHEELIYRDGQNPIVHLQADLYATVDWATRTQRRWAFTLSNAGASYFEDRADLAQLHEINWKAVETNSWSGKGIDSSIKEGKQAEFLVEHDIPWQLIERIGVCSQGTQQLALDYLADQAHKPPVQIKRDWYY